MSRVFALARITFKEGIRNRSLFGIALFSLFIFGLNVAVAGFFMRDIGKVTVDMNLSAISFSGLLLVLFVGLNLLAKDIDKKTIQLVLSRPIRRVEYIFGKYIGVLMFVFVSLVLLLALSCSTVLLLKFIYADYFISFSWSVFFIAAFFIYVKLAVLCSIVFFFSSITTSSFVTLIFSISSYVAGETLEDVIFYIRSGFRNEEISPLLQNLVEGISYIFPNFSVFDFKIEAAHGLAVSGERIALSLGYGLTYIILSLLLASFIFQKREFN